MELHRGKLQLNQDSLVSTDDHLCCFYRRDCLLKNIRNLSKMAATHGNFSSSWVVVDPCDREEAWIVRYSLD
jgi:hypothetical protein